MESVSWRQRAQYNFDNWMSRGTIAIMVLLGLGTVIFVFIIAVLVGATQAYPEGTEQGDFWDIAWGNLMRTLDPGTMGTDAGWGFRVLMLAVTIGGLIIVASLIGIVSGAFDDKMSQLRKGRSRVIESDHTVILGWNDQLFTIISELCAANADKRRSAIVILADHDKVEMEDEIRAKVTKTGKTVIICRTGNPHSTLDLRLASPTTARSIVVLPHEDDRHADMTVIKTVLALTHQLSTDQGPIIIAELRDPSNLDAARLAGRGFARWVLAGELIDRMTVQTCLQPGLSAVWSELLTFAGDEIYFTHQPSLVGSTYLNAQFGFAESVVIGLARGEAIDLNPPAKEVVGPDDRLIVIAADHTSIRITPPGQADDSLIKPQASRPPLAHRTLVLGYHSALQGMLEDLAEYVGPGSEVTVVADFAEPQIISPAGLFVTTRQADTSSRSLLESLGVESFDHVLVLAYRGTLEPADADAKTLVTLLHLRDIADRKGISLSIVSEMLDDRNRELAEVTRPDDFIVSDYLASLMLAQVSANRSLITVFEELFNTGGKEIYVRSADLYVPAESEADFYTIVKAAAAREETAIGYRVAADSSSRARRYGVRLNPPKGDRRTYTKGDSVIVVAANL